MTVVPKWLKKQADEQRRIRQNQPQISSEEAQRQVNRVMRVSGGDARSTSRWSSTAEFTVK